MRLELLPASAMAAVLALALTAPASAQAVDPRAPDSAAGGVLAQAQETAPGAGEAERPGVVDPDAPDSAAGGLLAGSPGTVDPAAPDSAAGGTVADAAPVPAPGGDDPAAARTGN